MNPRMIGYLTNPDANPVVKSFYVKMEMDDEQVGFPDVRRARLWMTFRTCLYL